MPRTVCLFALLFLAAPLAQGADPPPADAPVSYYKQIRPIFQTHCQGCHQPAKRGGEYVMTAFEQMLKGGESSEAAIVPGQPDKSHLLGQIKPKDGQAAMPKGAKPLAEVEISLVSNWIAQGAKDDSPPCHQGPVRHGPSARIPGLACDYVAGLFSSKGDLLAISGYHEVLLHKADGSGLVARLVGLIRTDRIGRLLSRWHKTRRDGWFAGPLRRGAGLGCCKEGTQALAASWL